MSDLSELSRTIAAAIDEHFSTSTHTELLMRQGLAIAEEAGEFVSALRRYLGVARRPGTIADVAEELADVVITAYTAAQRLGIDLDSAIEDKKQLIFTRGWKITPTQAVNP